MEWVLLSVVKNPLMKIPMTYNILLCLGDLWSSYFPHLSISCSGSLCSSNTQSFFLLCINPLPKTLCPRWPHPHTSSQGMLLPQVFFFLHDWLLHVIQVSVRMWPSQRGFHGHQSNEVPPHFIPTLSTTFLDWIFSKHLPLPGIILFDSLLVYK